jgi:tRNA pseudouridine38-40 synthase
MSKLYKLEVQYQGSGFSGWQSQPDGSSVQDHIERALAQINAQSLRLTGASRTDAGVHALHQVATFSSEKDLDCRRTLTSLNAVLPRTIGIRSLQEVPQDFHPIYAAKSKIYRYSLWLGRQRNPFLEPYVYEVSEGIDLEAMRAAGKHFVGEHDFTSFCAVDSGAKTRVRNVRGIFFEQNAALINIFVWGDGFLKQMVRSMVGSLVDVGLGKHAPEKIVQILAGRDRSLAGATAPAQGLCLLKIFYENPVDVENIIKTTPFFA